MIVVKIYQANGNLAKVYEDIWDIGIDPVSVSGVDFYSQNGRNARFSVVLDEWLITNIVEPTEVLEYKYLPFIFEIWRDEARLFLGFSKANNEIDDNPILSTITIQLYDVLHALLEWNENKEMINDGTVNVAVMDELVRTMGIMIGNAEALFAGRTNFVNNYVLSPTSMQLTVNIPLFDWTRNIEVDLTAYQHLLVVRQSLVGYVSGGDLYVEYVYYVRALNVNPQPGSAPWYCREHCYWCKWKVVDRSLQVVREESKNKYFSGVQLVFGEGDPVISLMFDEVANKPVHAIDGLPIAPVNGVETFVQGGYRYVIDGSRWSVESKASELFQTNPDVDTVPINDWMGALLRLICGYLAQDGANLVLEDRLAWSSVADYELDQDDVIGSVSRGSFEDDGLEIDFNFIRDGEIIAAGVKDFFRNTVLRDLPMRFRMDIRAIDVAPGMILKWQGWYIMLTSVQPDPLWPVVAVEGVGRR